MTHRYIKIGVTATVLLAAFLGLMWTTFSDGADYFKDVDEVLANRTAVEGKTLQLHGFVVPHSIMQKPNTLEYIFKVQNNGQVVNARYTGIVPDTFKDTPGSEAEVVLKGTLTADGFHTEPNGVMAKCPSKYEKKS